MPRAPGDLPLLACPHQRSVCPAASPRPRFTFPMLIVSQAPFHIPDADHLPDLLSGCSANGYSGKGPLPVVLRGSLPI